MEEQKRIKLTHGSARVDKDVSPETVEALNKLSELAYNHDPMEGKAREFLRKYGWPDDERDLIVEIMVDFANQVNNVTDTRKKVSDEEIRELIKIGSSHAINVGGPISEEDVEFLRKEWIKIK